MLTIASEAAEMKAPERAIATVGHRICNKNDVNYSPPLLHEFKPPTSLAIYCHLALFNSAYAFQEMGSSLNKLKLSFKSAPA